MSDNSAKLEFKFNYACVSVFVSAFEYVYGCTRCGFALLCNCKLIYMYVFVNNEPWPKQVPMVRNKERIESFVLWWILFGLL